MTRPRAASAGADVGAYLLRSRVALQRCDYRPAFVKSMTTMVPVRDADPVAAIGAYWAGRHEATEQELRVLKVLADASALALTRTGLPLI